MARVLLRFAGVLILLTGLDVVELNAGERPNVLIILADDLGWSDPGCYGSEIETPVLDELARNGLRFTQFYNTARCWPSRAALLTGYYAQQIRRDALPGLPGGSRGVRPVWARLLPDLLKPAGYRSYHSGKWHIDGGQLAGGFDRSYSLDDHDRYFSPKRHTQDEKPLPTATRESGYYASTAIAGHAIDCLREHAEKHSGKPFFQFVAFTAPHFPLQAPAEDVARFRERYHAGWDEIRAARFQRQQQWKLTEAGLSVVEREVGPPYHFPDALEKLGPGEINRPLPWSELSAAQREFQAAKMAVHAAMVHRMDKEIGRIVEQVKAMNALQNTLILFLSDNGASAEIMVRGDGHQLDAPAGSAETFLCLGPGWSNTANTPFRRHKTWVHEGGISTPLIVHWPEGIRAKGELRHNPGHLIDIVPTVLDVAAVPHLKEWEGTAVPPAPGRSLQPAFVKDGSVTHDCLWWLHEGNRALRVGDWKIVASGGADAAWELYDMARDRSETRNLAEQMPDKVRELEAVWLKKVEEFRDLATRGTNTR